jgi:hypothetical protein
VLRQEGQPRLVGHRRAPMTASSATASASPVKAFIDAMLRADLDAPRKQRHTVDRVMRRLAAEHDFELASYSTVRDYVRARRPAGAGRATGGPPASGGDGPAGEASG